MFAPFRSGSFRKQAVIWGDAIFPLFLDCSAGLDILYLERVILSILGARQILYFCVVYAQDFHPAGLHK